jgi:Leu/Phe-tRNA-protein transferase
MRHYRGTGNYPGQIIRYTRSGYIFITPEDDPDRVVEALLNTGYSEEFCLALDFDPPFIAGLMWAGFLVMSTKMGDPEAGPEQAPEYLLVPKFHLERSVLFFPDLHVPKSLGRFLKRYELRFNTDFGHILDRCAAVHGDDWLTPPLRNCFRAIRSLGVYRKCHRLLEGAPVRPVSFGVYQDGTLKAGEFGVMAGRVYTSYSGYHDENSAGMVQMVLTAHWLRDRGFAFLDLGMPLEYKDRLGARRVEPRRFAELFRGARMC